MTTPLRKAIEADAEFVHHMLKEVRAGNVARKYGAVDKMLWVGDRTTAYRALRSEDECFHDMIAADTVADDRTILVDADGESFLVWTQRLTAKGHEALRYAESKMDER